jgi:predicted aspartyl protease
VLDGRLPLKFILDTGVSSAILFDKQITDLLGISYSRKITVLGVGEENSVEAYVAMDVQIDMQGITGYRQSILALEEDYLQLKNQLGIEVHGILGYEIFSRFIVEINYPEKKVILYDPEYFKPHKSWHAIDMEVYVTKPFIKVPFSIDGREVIEGHFIIDTGASHALLIHEASDERIKIPEKRVNAVLGKGLTGMINGHLARIDKMKLGTFSFEDVIVSFPDENSYLDSMVYIHKNGTIGGELLARFRVIFDYMNGKMYLKRSVLTDSDFEYNMSGIDIEAVGPLLNMLRVANVRENSPGDSAGIKVDDVILSINGLYGENLTLSSTYKMFNSREGKQIRILYVRDRVRHKAKFFLRKEI